MMKKLLITIGSCALVGMSAASFAATADSSNVNDTSAPFIGGTVGFARANYGDLDKALYDAAPSSSQGGVDAGAYIGWHFNQYFDAQVGYLYLPTNKYSGGGNSLSLKTQAIDLLGKAYLPLSNLSSSITTPVSVYAQAGAAYVFSKFDGDVQGASFTVDKHDGLEPAYGVGVAYSFNKNVVADINWLQIYGPKVSAGDSSLKSPLINTINLGLTYRFTNLS